MKFVIITLSLAFVKTQFSTQRIIGGYEAIIEDFPWQVSITYAGRHNCGGSILSNVFILTAAHCTHRLAINKMRVRVGSSYRDRGGFIYTPTDVYHHPKFNPANFQNDISILKLDDKIVYTNKVQPVTLLNQGNPLPKAGTSATVSGFGKWDKDEKMSSRLRAVDVVIIARETCKNRNRNYLVDESMLCTANPRGGKDACAGYNGGPLTVNDVQIGIVSWGIGCGSPKHPSVFASVERLSNFISSIVD